MSQSDRDYFHRRERQHRELAESAADAPARAIHGRMAECYAQRARDLGVVPNPRPDRPERG